MATDLDIVNRALVFISESQLPDLTGQDDITKAVNLLLPLSRRAVLRDCRPNFAAKWAQLNTPEATNVLMPDYLNVHQLPTDEVRTLQVKQAPFIDAVGLDPAQRWKKQGRYVGTSFADIYLHYIFDQVDYQQWDDLSALALSYMLGYQLTWPLTESRAKRPDMLQGYAIAKGDVLQTDVQEGVPDKWRSTNRLMLVREGGRLGHNW